jgi:serine/threonine-protein kinase RsbW
MNNQKNEIRVTIKSQLTELVKMEHLSRKVAKTMHLDDDQKDNLSIAVTEAVGNAIVHGNKKDPEKKVDILFEITQNQVVVSVTDQGPGFKLNQLADPLDPDNVMKESGRGVFILKMLMDDVKFTFSPKGTTITFTLKRKDVQP